MQDGRQVLARALALRRQGRRLGRIATERTVPASADGVVVERRTAAWVAWSIVAVYWGLGALGFVVRAANDPGLRFIQEVSPWLAFGAYPTVGAIIIARQLRNTIGWLCCAVGLAVGPAFFAQQYAWYALVHRPGSLPGGLAMGWLGSWPWYLAAGLFLLFVPLLFPNGRLVSPRWRPVAWAALVVTALACGWAAFGPHPLWVPASMAANPWGIESAEAAFRLVERICPPGFAIMTIVSVASVVVRFRRARGVERQQLKWFLSGMALLALVWIGVVLTGLQYRLPLPVIAVAEMVGLMAVPVAIGVAILRYHLYAIDLLINRSLVYGALTALVAGVYVLVVGWLGALFHVRGSLWVSLLGAGVVAVLFAPARERLQQGVDRLLYGDRDRPEVVLSRLGRRLEAALAIDQVLPTVVRTVAEALKLPYVAVEVTRDGSVETAAAHGTPPAGRESVALVYGGEPVGWLVLGLRAGEQAFGPADRRLLDELAHQIGAAVHAVRLTDTALRLSADLQRSRQRLVTTREEERRRLRRDLHDGLGPALAGLSMLAEAAKDCLAGDPAAAQRLLDDLVGRAQDATVEVRRLVYALRPPALDALGLVGALRAQAARHPDHGPHVTVTTPAELPPLPAAAEVAAYLIALEAVTNSRRHAQARTCTIRLSFDQPAGTLRLEVTDDGRGLQQPTPAGVGLASMRERAAELGGTCTITTSPAGGTRVVAELPCTNLQPAAAATVQPPPRR